MKLADDLVLASHNPGKLEELTALLGSYGLTIKSAAELGIPEPEETGSTLVENAILKAKFVAQASDKPALADDSGFMIEALENFPGVKSARYVKRFPNLEACFEDLHKWLGPNQSTAAYFECALCLYWPDGRHEQFMGRIDGDFVYPARGYDGFCFDLVFQPKGYDKTFAELGREVKNKISHRAKAFNKFIESCLTT